MRQWTNLPSVHLYILIIAKIMPHLMNSSIKLNPHFGPIYFKCIALMMIVTWEQLLQHQVPSSLSSILIRSFMNFNSTTALQVFPEPEILFLRIELGGYCPEIWYRFSHGLKSWCVSLGKCNIPVMVIGSWLVPGLLFSSLVSYRVLCLPQWACCKG